MSGTLTMMLLGAGIGGGIWLVLAGLRPRPVPLWLQLQLIRRPGRSVAESSEPALAADRRSVIGRGALRVLGAAGVGESTVLNERLRILDKSIERHAYEKLLAATTGFGLPLFVGLVLASSGTPGAPVFPLSLIHISEPTRPY